MRTRSLLLVTAVMAAWPAAAQSRSRFDLSGAWTSGSGTEPAARRVTMSAPCNYTPAYWSIQQDGNRVRAWTTPAHRAQGIAIKDRSSPPAAVGRIDGVRVTMRLDTLRYVLRYDRASGHLRGTVNGTPFWAIPVDIVEPGGCINVR